MNSTYEFTLKERPN